jgi:hypothetical protein
VDRQLFVGMVRRESGRPILAAIVLCAAGAVCAQDPSAVPEPSAPRVNINTGSVYLYRGERWGSLRLLLINPGDEPAELMSSTFFVGEPTQQYGRRCWVPAKARLETTQLVRCPTPSDPVQQLIDVRTLLVAEGRAGETLLSRQVTGELQLERSVRLASAGPITAIIERPPPQVLTDTAPLTAADFLATARTQRDLTKNLVYLLDGKLPADDVALDALDQLVIADDRVVTDLPGLVAVRRWVAGGGRLWVMLDRVDARLLEAMLGDEFAVEVVDRVGLTTVAVENPNGTPASSPREFERPVDHVRVVVEDAEVAFLVNGWPAAFWKTCGRGRVLVTTLGTEAWVLPKSDRTHGRLRDALLEVSVVADEALNQLALPLFAPRPKAPIPPQVAETQVTQYVGYAIPSRGFVIGGLAAFTGVLLTLGVWLSRQSKLEQFAGWAPLVSTVVGGVLVFSGRQARQEIPPTSAQLQFVQAIAGTEDVLISGTAAVFSPDAGTTALTGTQGGWCLPDAAGNEGTTRRLIWSDTDRWQWEHIPQVPGLRTADYTEAHALSSPFAAFVTLDESGVAGRLELPDSLAPEDGVLASPSGRIGVRFQANGAFTATAADVLTADQALAADVLSDEQRRRGQTLPAVLAASPPLEPTLLFWTQPWPMGLQFRPDAQPAGAALVSCPVRFQRPAVGTEITVPATLISFRETTGPDGTVPTGLYDPRQQEWTERHRPTQAWLEFRVPAGLVPLKPQSARLVVRVTGPMGKLGIDGHMNGVTTPLHTWIDPVGTLTHDFTLRELPALDSKGTLKLRIAAGDPDRPELTVHESEGVQHVSPWQIVSLSLELRASVIADD